MENKLSFTLNSGGVVGIKTNDTLEDNRSHEGPKAKQQSQNKQIWLRYVALGFFVGLRLWASSPLVVPLLECK